MLTIFAVPKAFEGHIGIIQRNAVRSWTLLNHSCEIILCGDDSGTAEMASEIGAKYIPDIARNKYGTPLVNSLFDQAAKAASNRLLCYVNADIILVGNFLDVINSIKMKSFLMVGRRWNMAITEPLNFGRRGWELDLRARVFHYGELSSPTEIDYFVFPRDGGLADLPPFAIGRPGWDNWFIYLARRLGMAVIDATELVMVIHQNHDYSHVLNRKGADWEGPEADLNRQLVGGWEYFFNLSDATHLMTERGLRRALGREYLRQRWYKMPVLFPHLSPIILLINSLRSQIRWPRNHNDSEGD